MCPVLSGWKDYVQVSSIILSNSFCTSYYDVPTLFSLTSFSGGRDRVVLVWNLSKFERVSTIAVDESIESMLLLPRLSGDVTPYSPELNVDPNTCNLLTVGHDGETCLPLYFFKMMTFCYVTRCVADLEHVTTALRLLEGRVQ